MLSKISGLRRGFTGFSAVANRAYYGKLLATANPPNTKLSCGNVNNVAITQRRFYRCDAHMNELPVPCMPWEPWYSDKQSFYNKILVLGILWWLFSLGMMIYTDSIYLNWGPPKQPSPPSDMVEECDDSE